MKSKHRFILMALLVATQPLLAQHSGHRMGGVGSGSSGHADNTMSDMQKTMAVQATEEQSDHLRSWIQSTDRLGKQVDNLRRLVTSHASGDFSNVLDALKAALDTNADVYDGFVKNLSGPQHSALKKLVRKLDKANSALVRASAEISKISEHTNAKQIGDALLKTKKAIGELQREQQRLAREMGAKV